MAVKDSTTVSKYLMYFIRRGDNVRIAIRQCTLCKCLQDNLKRYDRFASENEECVTFKRAVSNMRKC